MIGCYLQCVVTVFCCCCVCLFAVGRCSSLFVMFLCFCCSHSVSHWVIYQLLRQLRKKRNNNKQHKQRTTTSKQMRNRLKQSNAIGCSNKNHVKRTTSSKNATTTITMTLTITIRTIRTIRAIAMTTTENKGRKKERNKPQPPTNRQPNEWINR